MMTEAEKTELRELKHMLGRAQEARNALEENLEAALALKTEFDALRRKWESDKPGTPGRMFRGLLQAVEEVCASGGSSKPPSEHVRELGRALAASREREAKLRETLLFISLNSQSHNHARQMARDSL